MKRILFILAAVSCLFSASIEAEAKNLDCAMISITLDDGGISNMVAQSVLTKYQIPATLYIVPEWIGDGQNLTWDQLWLLYWSHGWEIGNHTFSHQDLALLDEEQIIAELKEAQNSFLQHGLFCSGAFAPPYGEFDNRVMAVAKKLGFITSSRQAWTEDSAFNDPATFNEWAINVVSLKRNTSALSIKNFIDRAVAEKKWIVFVIHDVVQVPVNDYEISTALLTQLASYINSLKISNKLHPTTISKGVGKMKYYQGLP